jgi:peptidoglycan/LPS O-acetylase OafA/YrhL
VSTDLVVLVICGLWVTCAYAGLPGWIDNRSTRFLGRVSYSLYLLHPLVIVLLLRAGLYDWLKAHAGGWYPAFFAACLVTLGVTALLSAVTYRLIESPGIKLGERLLQKREPAMIVREQW